MSDAIAQQFQQDHPELFASTQEGATQPPNAKSEDPVAAQFQKEHPELFNLTQGESGSAPSGSVTVEAAPSQFDVGDVGAGVIGGIAGKIFNQPMTEEVIKPPVTDAALNTAKVNANVAQNAFERAHQTHAENILNTYQQHQAAHNVYKDAEAELKLAQKEAAKHGIYTPSTQKTELGKLIVAEEGLPPAQGKNVLKPLGGVATENYGKSYGLTDFDAARAIDTTKNEEGVWDIMKQVKNAEAKIGPGYAMVPERSNIMLPTHPSSARGAPRVDTSVADAARARLAEATAAHNQAKSEFMSLEEALAQLKGNTPAEVLRNKEMAARLADKARLLQESAALPELTNMGKVWNGAKWVAGKAAGPATAGFGAYDLYEAGKDINEGRTAAAIAHTVGGLGGLASLTPYPPAKVIGTGLAIGAPLTYEAGKKAGLWK
jgi:hypothetical protein